MTVLVQRSTRYLMACVFPIVTFNTCFAEEEKRFLFIHTHSPPFVIHQAGKEPTGIFSAYFIPMLKACKVAYQFQYYPDRRIVKMLMEGKSDLSVSLRPFFKPQLYAVSDIPLKSLSYSMFSN